MLLWTYLLSSFILLSFAYLVFRVLVRREYQSHQRLRPTASMAQLLVFIVLMSFPYLFSPPDWPRFWQLPGSAPRIVQQLGVVLIILGFILAFITMAWFGIGRAFGLDVSGLKTQGPYRLSRNPQILGGYLLVIGTAIQWRSMYAYGWILFYALIGHWMILTEEEHLHQVFGQAYEAYCDRTPRYLALIRRGAAS